jgi:hypothetical protein
MSTLDGADMAGIDVVVAAEAELAGTNMAADPATARPSASARSVMMLIPPEGVVVSLRRVIMHQD